MKTYAKFGVLTVLIVGSLVWLAMGGISETQTYYKTIPELQKMGKAAQGQRLRVGGDVVAGSIVKNGIRSGFRAEAGTSAVKGRLPRQRSSSGYIQAWRAGAGGWPPGI